MTAASNIPEYLPPFTDPGLSEVLVHAIPLPIFYKSLEGRYLGCNTAFCEMLGVYEKDIIGKTAFDLAPEELARFYEEKDRELLRNRGTQVYETIVRFADGALHAVLFNKAVFYDKDGTPTGIIGVILDITDRAEAARKIAHQATHDELTGLINRYELQAVIEKNHAQSQRRQHPYAILLLDLDRFKLINDNYGHPIGDQALQTVAAALRSASRESDWFGRWGGEEFLCLLPETNAAEATLAAERMRQRVEATSLPFREREIRLTTSIGVACYPDDADSTETLLAAADAALYEAKRAGRNRVNYAKHQTFGIYSMAGQLEIALQEGLLKAAYQPIVELSSERVVAEEALVRIDRPDNEMLEAIQFIDAADHLQLTHKIDHYMALQAIKRCTNLVKEGRQIKHFVNFSADLLRHPQLVQEIIEQATCSYRAGNNFTGAIKPLVIEITEREFLGNIKETRNILAPLIDFGIQIAIDDFGSGFSSFQYLADLPVSYLKIEGDLIKRVKNEKRVFAIVKAIQEIASDLNLISIAEHIEDQDTAAILRDIGIDWGQGYLYGRPEC